MTVGNGFRSISLPFSAVLHSHKHGNYCGNVNFIWRLPEEEEDRTDAATVRAITSIKENIKVHSTRQMMKELVGPFQLSPKLKPAVLRNMVEYLSSNLELPHNHISDKGFDKRLVATCIHPADDRDFI